MDLSLKFDSPNPLKQPLVNFALLLPLHGNVVALQRLGKQFLPRLKSSQLALELRDNDLWLGVAFMQSVNAQVFLL